MMTASPATRKPTQRERILALLADRRWHTTAELNEICFRYGARLFEMRRDGYVFDEERIGAGPLWRWRLVETPDQAALAPHLERTGAVIAAKRESRGGSASSAGSGVVAQSRRSRGSGRSALTLFEQTNHDGRITEETNGHDEHWLSSSRRR